MKAIQTKVIPATNDKPTRIKAWAQTTDNDRRQIIISKSFEFDGELCFREAALALCEKLDWPTDLIGGATKDGYVFVFNPMEVL